MGVLRHSYFFADLQTILQEYGLACKNFFNLYQNKRMNGIKEHILHLFYQFVNCIQHIVIV